MISLAMLSTCVSAKVFSLKEETKSMAVSIFAKARLKKVVSCSSIATFSESMFFLITFLIPSLIASSRSMFCLVMAPILMRRMGKHVRTVSICNNV